MHILDSGSQAMNGADNGTLGSRTYPVQNDKPLPPPGNPSGVLRALVFYEDPDCLDILADMLEDCRYQVTRCSSFDNALRMLMQNRDGFDIFLSNAVVYGVDGFKLLGRVSKQMDIPVIVMSIEDCTPVTIRCIFHGFCDYLIGHNRKEVLGDLWRHVRRRRKCTPGDPAQTVNPSNGSGRRQEEKEATTGRLLKKPRVAWDRPLHQRFVAAVNQLGGVNNAVPKRIWETMDIPWLTKDNVSSHLQKYRDQVLSEKKAKGSRKKPPVPKPVSSNVQEHPRNEVWDIDTRSWTRQHPIMNGDEWHRSPQAFPSMNIDVQMGLLHQSTEPVTAGNGGQVNFSDCRLAEISTPQPPPPLPLDFSVSSYSAFWSEEPSIDYHASEMGHQECELTSILEGFRPGSIIPRHPPGNAISGQSAIPDQEQREGTGIYEDKLGFDGCNSEDIVPN